MAVATGDAWNSPRTTTLDAAEGITNLYEVNPPGGSENVEGPTASCWEKPVFARKTCIASLSWKIMPVAMAASRAKIVTMIKLCDLLPMADAKPAVAGTACVDADG
jgi:hypothetical protein